MDLGFVAADVLRPAHAPRAQRLVLDSVMCAVGKIMNFVYTAGLYIYIYIHIYI